MVEKFGIVIYLEGDKQLRSAMSQFLAPIRDEARAKKLTFDVIPCGDKARTAKLFADARTSPDRIKFLLVDSDEYPWKKAGERRHLMVQIMEAWFLADWEMLARHFGVNEDDPNRNGDVERLSKTAVESTLRRLAQRRGNNKPYHKTVDAPKILATVRVDKVAARAAHCGHFCRDVRSTIASVRPQAG